MAAPSDEYPLTITKEVDRCGAAALVALSANLLDVVLGFGGMGIIVLGTKTAIDWFALYRENWFKGLYGLDFLNIIYLASLVPVYFALFAAHRRTNRVYAGLAMILSFIGTAIHIAKSSVLRCAPTSIGCSMAFRRTRKHSRRRRATCSRFCSVMKLRFSLWQLVAAGLVTPDAFEGLRSLMTGEAKRKERSPGKAPPAAADSGRDFGVPVV